MPEMQAADEAGAGRPGLIAEVGRAGRYLAQSLRLMVGVPDYGADLKHMATTHPDRPAMSYEAFFPRASGSAVWRRGPHRALLLRLRD